MFKENSFSGYIDVLIKQNEVPFQAVSFLSVNVLSFTTIHSQPGLLLPSSPQDHDYSKI